LQRQIGVKHAGKRLSQRGHTVIKRSVCVKEKTKMPSLKVIAFGSFSLMAVGITGFVRLLINSNI